MIERATPATEKLAVTREKIRQALIAANEPKDAAAGTHGATVVALLKLSAQSNPFVLVAGAFVTGGLLVSNRLAITALTGVLVKEAAAHLVPAILAVPSQAGWTEIVGAVLRSVETTAPLKGRSPE